MQRAILGAIILALSSFVQAGTTPAVPAGYNYYTSGLSNATNTGTYRVTFKLHDPNGPDTHTTITLDLSVPATGEQKAAELAAKINADSSNGLSAASVGNVITVQPTTVPQGGHGMLSVKAKDKTGQRDSWTKVRNPGSAAAPQWPATGSVPAVDVVPQQSLGIFRVEGLATGVHGLGGQSEVVFGGDDIVVSVFPLPGATPVEIAAALSAELTLAGAPHVLFDDVLILFLRRDAPSIEAGAMDRGLMAIYSLQ